MRDLTPKAYDVDCMGNPARWPWVVGSAVVGQRLTSVPALYVPKPRPLPDPKAIRPCTALGCTSPCAAVRKRTHPELYDFCDRHRIAGATRIRRGVHPEIVADDLTAGSRVIGRPRSAA